ncbi:MAG: hypothetical protein ABIH20_06595 [Candidatus Diapherotrites archaeon]
MTEITVITRKWGNSIGVSFSSDFVKEKNIGPNQKLRIEVKDEVKRPLPTVFGSLRGWKLDAQKLKNRLREESEW